MINAAIALVVNILLNIILSKFLGIGGLALATSISGILGTILLFINLRKKIGQFGIGNMVISFFKILFASLVMGAIAKPVYSYLCNYASKNLSLIISIGIGTMVYFAIIYFMKIEDVDTIINALKKKLKKLRLKI
jgi:putative peptidoglycan lipid II flippase